MALNLLALDEELGTAVAAAILQGGADAVREAGALVGGGHTIDDAEPKYGLAVFGMAHPDGIVRNSGARAGDALYLTKPLGTGIMVSAHACGLVDDDGLRPAVASMMELNDRAGAALLEAGAHAATDVTGFGLAGHLHEMLAASGQAAVLDFGALPLFEGAFALAQAYCRPSRAFSLIEQAEGYVSQGESRRTRPTTTGWACCATRRRRAGCWWPCRPRRRAPSSRPSRREREEGRHASAP